MQLKISNDFDVVIRKLENIHKKIRNPKPLLDVMGKAEVEKAKDRIINTKTSPEGLAWIHWAYSTVQAGNQGQSLLFNTGNLYNSFDYKVLRTGVVITNTAEYASHVNDDRQFLGWDHDEDSVVEMIKEYLDI